MTKTKVLKIRSLTLGAGIIAMWACSSTMLQAQSSTAEASEGLRLLELDESIAGKDKVIGEDDVRTFMKGKKGDPRLAQALQESKCDQNGGPTCDDWLEARGIVAFSRADRDGNKKIDAAELKDFEDTVIWGDLRLRDLLPGDHLPASASTPTAQKSTMGKWFGSGWAIRRSFLDETKASDPATIAWLHFGGGDETLNANQRRTRFDIQGAISKELTIMPWTVGETTWQVAPVLVVEADVSTDETLQRNSITHRLGAQIYGQRDIGSKWTAHFIDFTFDYKTDRDYRSEVLGATLQYTPNLPKLGVGAYTSSAGPLFFRWRPFLGLTYGDVRDPGRIASLQKTDGFTNAFARLRLELTIGNAKRITAAVEGQYLRELEEEDKGHTAYGGSLRFVLDRAEHAFLVLSYDQGEKPPSFTKKEQTKIALGVKF